jgi:hypothetical protein
MNDKSVVEIGQVLESFLEAHAPSQPRSPAPHADPLPEAYSIELLNDAKAQILRLSDQNGEIAESFYQLMCAIRGTHSAHKTVVRDMRRDHGDALVAHRQEIAGAARSTFHRVAPILRRYLRGELSLEQARTDILAAIDPALRDGEMANDLSSLLETANDLRLRNEAFVVKAGKADQFLAALKALST